MQSRNETYSNFFSRGLATLELAMLVGSSVRPSVRNKNKIWAFFAIPLLPTHPRLRGSVYGLVFFLSGGICRDFFYLNFESLYLMNELTNWHEYFYGNIIWFCPLMCEVQRNLSKYSHPNQPTCPKISKKCSYENILRNFLKFCMINHPTLGQILGKLYGDHVITLAVIA